MKTQLLLILGALALGQAHATSPSNSSPVPGEREQARQHCTQQRELVRNFVLIYGQARNDFAAEKEFGSYLRSALANAPDRHGADDGIAWLDENSLRIERALARVQREGKGSDTLAQDISAESVEGCEMSAIARVRQKAQMRRERQTEVDEAKQRCPQIANLESMSWPQLLRSCPK
jgi:hypothetical protein